MGDRRMKKLAEEERKRRKAIYQREYRQRDGKKAANYESVKKYKATHPEKVKEQMRRYREKRPDVSRAWRDNNRERLRELIRKSTDKRRGIDWEAAAKLRKERLVCDICNSDIKLHVDHDHLTGRIRGVLCANCNRGIGLFRDNKELLAKAIKYLDKEYELEVE